MPARLPLRLFPRPPWCEPNSAAADLWEAVSLARELPAGEAVPTAAGDHWACPAGRWAVGDPSATGPPEYRAPDGAAPYAGLERPGGADRGRGGGGRGQSPP